MKVLYVGGFCSGKTNKLIDTYLNLVNKNKVSPDNILFFTNNEDKTLEKILPNISSSGFTEFWIANYSSFCKKILKKHFFILNLPPNFEVVSGFEEKLIIEKVLKEVHLKHFGVMKKYSGFVDSVVDIIDLIKFNEDKFLNTPSDNFKIQDIKKIYELYQEELKLKNLFDYRDLLKGALRLFENKKDIFKLYLDQFKYIIIDDVQDINNLEFLLLEKFIDSSSEVYAGCNKSGTMYNFRGASPQKIMPKLEKYITEKINLDTNLNNPSKYLKVFAKDRDEINWIGRCIRDLIINEKCNFNDIIILQRGFEDNGELYREIFAELEIPFEFDGVNNIFSYPVIIFVIFFAKILNMLHKNDLRIPDEWIEYIFLFLNKDKNLALDFFKIKFYVNQNKKNLYFFLKDIVDEKKGILEENFVSGDFIECVKKIYEIINKLQDDVEKFSALSLIYNIIHKFNLWDIEVEVLVMFYKMVEDFEIIERRLNNNKMKLQDFINILDKMLSSYNLETRSQSKNKNTVQIKTIQKSKGEHFKIVFLKGACDGVIPRRYRENSIFSNKELNEMNIAVVKDREHFLKLEHFMFEYACSRAESSLFISYAKQYGSHKNFVMSLFVLENELFSSEEINKAEENILTYKDINNYDFDIKNIQTEKELKYYRIFNKLENFDKEKYCEDKTLLDFKRELLNNFKFSSSSLKCYNECPAKFLYNYMFNIKPLKNIGFVVGSVVHEIMENIHNMYASPAQIEKDKVNKIVDDVLEKNKNKFQDKLEFEWSKKRIKKIINEYVDENTGFETKIFELEKKFELELEKYKFTGRIDRIDLHKDSSLEIIDYKTGSSHKMEKALKTAIEKGDEFQMVLYFYGIKNLYKNIISYLSYYWLEKKTGAKKATLDINNEEIEELLKKGKQNLLDTVKQISVSNFNKKPKEKRDCLSCDYKILCDKNLSNEEE
jgi:DNA helicase II / ATP-dependent DNA helicase PcrA